MSNSSRKPHFIFFTIFSAIILLFSALSSYAKSIEIKPRIPIRPVTIKNISYSTNGHFLAIPNYITTGSVGVFTFSPEGKTVAVPSRFSEKNFYRSRGVFFYSGKKDTLTDLAFIPLQEFSQGYSVSFTNQGDTLAVSGGDKITIFTSDNWNIVKTIDLKFVSRAVYSFDNKKMAAVADGKIYLLNSNDYTVSSIIEPEQNCKFADVTFSNDGKIIAAVEYKNITLEHTCRVRLFLSENGNEERQLPWFTDKLSSIPGKHFPLISYLPNDTALCITLEKNLFGKTVVVKSNDGSLIREFKGNCHAISQNQSLFATGGMIYDLTTWNKVGEYNKYALCLSFDASMPYLSAVTLDNIRRVKIEH